tara:strand:- start:48 stop:443 length:396 start_codon:yes stop_codon:yes gene_type:complete
MDIQNSKNNSVLFIEDLLFYQDVFLNENINNKPKQFKLNTFVKTDDNKYVYVFDICANFKDDNRCGISLDHFYYLYILYCKYNDINSANKKDFLLNIQPFNVHHKKKKGPKYFSFYDDYYCKRFYDFDYKK